MIDSFVEGLESNDTKDRQGSCEVLAILQDSSVVSRLAYIAQSDPSSQVRYVRINIILQFRSINRINLIDIYSII